MVWVIAVFHAWNIIAIPYVPTSNQWYTRLKTNIEEFLRKSLFANCLACWLTKISNNKKDRKIPEQMLLTNYDKTFLCILTKHEMINRKDGNKTYLQNINISLRFMVCKTYNNTYDFKNTISSHFIHMTISPTLIWPRWGLKKNEEEKRFFCLFHSRIWNVWAVSWWF